jgi:hypothetical protein
MNPDPESKFNVNWKPDPEKINLPTTLPKWYYIPPFPFTSIQFHGIITDFFTILQIFFSLKIAYAVYSLLHVLQSPIG